MKKSILIIFALCFLFACKTLKVPLSDQIGAGKTYTSITYDPTVINAASKDFEDKWILAEKGVNELEKRRLQKLVITFVSSTEVLFNFNYIPPNGKGVAPAIFTYTAKKDDKGSLSFTLASKNANAKLISPAVRNVTDYIEKNQFKVDWVTEKVPGSHGTLAGLHNVNDPKSWFYGNIK